MSVKTKEKRPFVLFLVGPTAVGKSDVAVGLAKKIGGEIVSCDSMQVYRGMDIGTAKASQAMRRRVPHHMIDVVSPSRPFHVAAYRQQALRALRGIIARKKIPVVAGGTGLYFRALLDGLFEGPGPDPGLRATLQREAQLKGSAWLHTKLADVDPAAAHKIHPNNARKIVRALEVYHGSGQPISALQKQWDGKSTFPYDYVAIGLDMDRPELYRRVDLRVGRMFKQGLKKEVKDLVARGLARNPVACQAIGYKEVLGWMRGQYDGRRARELAQRNSRRFAKRQFTWFKKDARIKWIRIDRCTSRKVVNKILEKIARTNGAPGGKGRSGRS